jgi:8-amino-3,8-dideoxy-alpha-D-manno-octulosonate transaminase
MATKIERLAVDGGEPVRKAPPETGYPGARLIGDEEKELVLDVLERRTPFRFYGVNEPDKVFALEREVASQMGTTYALGVTSGTAALKVGLKALDIAPGDEVIVPALTFIASPGTVAAHHAIPVFADVNESLTLDPADIENRITSRTRAIMPVHTSGVAAEMDTIMDIARRHGLSVIEDCAQSAGTAYKNKAIGAWGDVGAFSLQVNKIVTAGEGGFVTTSNPVMYERAVRYHDHGNYRFGRMAAETSAPDDTMGDLTEYPPAQLDAFPGEVYRMGELAGALALAQIRKLPGIIERMRQAHNHIKQQTLGLPGVSLRHLPDPDGVAGVAFGLLVDDPANTAPFLKALRAEGIPARHVYAGKPVYNIEAIQNYRPAVGALTQEYAPGLCPQTEAIMARAILIGIGPGYTEEDCDDVVRGLWKVATQVLV